MRIKWYIFAYTFDSGLITLWHTTQFDWVFRINIIQNLEFTFCLSPFNIKLRKFQSSDSKHLWKAELFCACSPEILGLTVHSNSTDALKLMWNFSLENLHFTENLNKCASGILQLITNGTENHFRAIAFDDSLQKCNLMFVISSQMCVSSKT